MAEEQSKKQYIPFRRLGIRLDRAGSKKGCHRRRRHKWGRCSNRRVRSRSSSTHDPNGGLLELDVADIGGGLNSEVAARVLAARSRRIGPRRASEVRWSAQRTSMQH
jgi:hypothetical protein